MNLTLTSQLFQLLPEEERARSTGRRSVSLTARIWPEVTHEIRERFPRLADRVLTESGGIARGFALAVNDEIMPVGQRPSLKDGDEICIIVQLAGG
jgi:molybdopterin converting factor small subunit